MRAIFNLVLENWMYAILAMLVLFVLLCLISESFRDQLKKGVVLLLIVSGIGLGYYFITGRSPFNIPGDINRYFSDPQLQEQPSNRYYKDLEKRYGDQI